jgi:hypothetical protein
MEVVPAASRAGRDRLSELPDCLLHSVLSSLRSRQVVQSSLLSRRWRHLWRSVPCLDVDQRDFLSDEPEPEASAYKAPDVRLHSKVREERLDREREIKRQRSFEDFADAMLLFNGVSPLDACRLHVAHRDHRTGLHRWIRRGLARHPAELHVAYDCRSNNDDLLLPFDFRPKVYDAYDYDCRSNNDDDLLFPFDLAFGYASALPITGRLRRLHLSGLKLSQKFAGELRSECPVLEDLKLVNCRYDVDYRFGGSVAPRIASSSLKRLHIEGSYYSYYSLRQLDVLALPALVSMSLDKIFQLDIQDYALPSLAVASIADPDKYACKYRFLKSLRKARVLELRSFTTAVSESRPNFIFVLLLPVILMIS